MPTKPKAMSLDRFQFQAPETEFNILISACPKVIFAIHPQPSRVLEDVMVVFHEGRWYLVDYDLYRRHIFVRGMTRANIYEGVDTEGRPLLLIDTIPLSGEITSWRKTVAEVVYKARKNWVKMSRIEGEEGYQARVIKNMADKPQWTKQPFKELVWEAFGDNIITDDNLPDELTGKRSKTYSNMGHRHRGRNQRDIEEEFDE